MSNVLRATPVQGLDTADAVNYDSDQDILGKTIIRDGKWQFYEGERLIAEAAAPSDPTREVLEQWAGAVRQRVKRELTQEDTDKRDAARKEKVRIENGGIVGTDGELLSSDSSPSVDSVESVEVEEPATETTAAPSVDDDPDAFVDSKIDLAAKKLSAIIIKRTELQEALAELEDEYQAAADEKAKWERMKEAING